MSGTVRTFLAWTAIAVLALDPAIRAQGAAGVNLEARSTPEAAVRLEWRIQESELTSQLRQIGIDFGGVRTRGESDDPDLSAEFTGAIALLGQTTALAEGTVRTRATSRLSGDELDDAIKTLGDTSGVTSSGTTTKTDSTTTKTDSTATKTDTTTKSDADLLKTGTTTDRTKLADSTDTPTKISDTPTKTETVRTDDRSKIEEALSGTTTIPDTKTDTGDVSRIDTTKLPETNVVTDPRLLDRLRNQDSTDDGGKTSTGDVSKLPDTNTTIITDPRIQDRVRVDVPETEEPSKTGDTKIVTDPKVEFVRIQDPTKVVREEPDRTDTKTGTIRLPDDTRPVFVPGVKTRPPATDTKTDDPRSGFKPGGKTEIGDVIDNLKDRVKDGEDVRIPQPDKTAGDGTKIPGGKLPGTGRDDIRLPDDRPIKKPIPQDGPARPPEVDAPFWIRIDRSAEGERTREITAGAPLAPIVVSRKGLPRMVVGSFIDDTVERGKTYRYRLRLTDENGRQTFATTPEVTVAANDGLPPLAVRDPRATPAADSITIEWTPLDDPEVEGYRIYRVDAEQRRELVPKLLQDQKKTARRGRFDSGGRSLGGGGALGGDDRRRGGRVGQVDAQRAGRFVDRSVEPERSYAYVVVAFDPFDGEGEDSPAVVAETLDVTPPSAPSSAAAAPGDGGIVDVSWTVSSSSDVMRHHVYRVIGNEDPGLRIATVERSASPATAARDFLSPRSQYVYRYRVTAADDAGNESEAAVTAPVRLPDIVPPRPPAVSGLRGEDRAVVLDWMAPPDADVAGYRVYRQDGPDDPPQRIANGLTSRTFRDDGLPVGATFTWWVTAVDGAGLESEPSRSFTRKVTGNIDRSPPGGVAVSTGADGRPRVTWEPVTGSVEVVYVVFRGTAPGGLFAPVSGTLRDTAFTDRTEGAGGLAFYRVVARHVDGTLSRPSDPVAFAVRAGGGGSR